MEDNFKLEIISPEKIIFSDSVKMTRVPSYEGDMSILKDHISIITFLRPGIVKIKKKDDNFEEFFIEDGTVEFFNNILILLSTSAVSIKDLTKEFLDNLTKESEKRLAKENITDQDRYMYKLRLNPTKPQVRNFDTSDIDDPEIGRILNTHHGWEGNDHRYELMKRVELWRYVSDQPDYDVGEHFLRRREYQPQKAMM